MHHLIFWLYNVSLIFGIISTFVAIMTLPVKNIKWLGYYTYLLISFNIMIVTYILHYFLYIYVGNVPGVLSNIFSLFIGLAILAILVVSYQLLFHTLNITLNKMGRVIFLTLSLLCVSLIILMAFFPNNTIRTISLYVYIILFLCLFIISIIFRGKIFNKRNIKKKIILTLLACGILGFIGELAEVMFRRDLHYTSNSIPIGVVSFSFFSLALNLINFLYCYNKLKERKIGFLYSDNIPDGYLTHFNITSTEKDIILYLLNAYT